MNIKYTYSNLLTLVFVIITIILMTSCNDDEDKVNSDVKKFSFSSFKIKKNITFSIIKDFPQGEPEKFMMVDTNLILINTLNQNDSYFLYLLTTNGEIKKEFFKKGDGPQEAISMSSIGFLNDKFYGYDITKNELTWCFKDSLLKNSNVSFSKETLGLKRFYDLIYLNDTIVIGTGDPLSNKKISFYNISSKAIFGEYGEFPKSYVGTLNAFKDAATAYIDIRPDKKRILLTYRYTDVIEIYDEKGKLVVALQGPENINLNYIPQGDIAKKTKKTKKAYVNTYVTNEYLYLLFTGNTKKDKTKWTYGNIVLVIDWDGNLKELLELNERIYTFAIDEIKDIIYSCNENGELLKANLK